MSSASTAINIKYKIKGGNLTFNTNGHLADALLLAHLECEKLNAPVDLLFGEYGEISQHFNLTQEILFFRVSKEELGVGGTYFNREEGKIDLSLNLSLLQQLLSSHCTGNYVGSDHVYLTKKPNII